jgi:hypothetical protein
MTSTLALGAILVVSAAQGQPAQNLQVRAYMSTAGPYGESWELKLGEDGRVTLQILYMINPLGKMSGDFLASPERIAAVRQAIEAEKFAELPADLWPAAAPLHQPDLRLTVTSGQRTHEVKLYDPAQFKDDVRARRFMAVWSRVFDLVPLRPKW